MITPQFITLDGRPGTVVYLDADWHPVTPEQATMAQVLFDDGGTAFYQTAVHTSAQKFDPEERRDAKGRWTKGGKAGLLTTDDVDEQIAHITRQRAYAHYGVRVDNNPSLKVGQVAPVSSDWSEDDHPKTLEGTAAVVVRDWTRVINYSGSQIVLMGSAEAHPGTDKNEIVMPDAVVLGIWPTPVWGPTKRRAKAEGIGGITKKFDEALHPRGEDGRFIEATSPRIFKKPEDVELQGKMHGEDYFQWVKEPGHLLTGQPIPRDQIPKTLYHVTTNAPAVESSGVLLGLLESGGLGGGQEEGVSFTSSKEDAVIIQRELRRAVQIARGDVDFGVFDEWARNDELVGGLREGALAPAVTYMRDFVEGNIHSIQGAWVSDPTGEYADENRGKTFGHIGPLAPEERERLRRSLMKDALNAYLQIRERTAEEAKGQPVPILKNPLLFGRQEQLAKLDVKNIQILEIPSAQIPEGALVTTGSDKFLHEVRAYSDVPLRKPVHSSAKAETAFDEALHPREPGGTPIGGQFTASAGGPTSDPTLAAQAVTGIAAVEKLLPEALKTSGFTPESEGVSWATVDLSTKVAVQAKYVAFAIEDWQGYKDLPTKMAAIHQTWDALTDQDKTNIMNHYVITGQITKRTLDPKEPAHWATGIEAESVADEDYARTHALALRLTELRTDQLRQERGLLGPVEKPTYTIEESNRSYEGNRDYLIKDSGGVVVGASNTMEQARFNAENWARGVQNEGQVTTEHLIDSVWSSWKAKSSEGLSLSLQLAAAKEFGGVHRMTPQEVDEATQFASSFGGIPTLQAYVRAQWDVTQMVMAKAGTQKVDVYRAIMLPGDEVAATPKARVDAVGYPIAPPKNIKVFDQGVEPGQATPDGWSKAGNKTYVAFDYNGEHFVVEKEVAMKRPKYTSITEIPKDPDEGYVATIESTEDAIERRINEYHNSVSGKVYTKLPALQLRRAGAQSTTGTRDVANQWAGVGNLPDNPTRVVLRIEAPPTSVLSLPVYGKNVQEEHEAVLIGTRDRWVWDAWKTRAPNLDSHTFSGTLKAEVMPVIVDLQAEDRGKPHWLSGVDWAAVHSVAKFDEAQHPRDKDGQFTTAYYHGTSNELAEKILKEGLKPLSERDPESGVVAGKGFASTSEKVALSYAAMASDDSVDTITVFVFKPEASQYFTPANKHAFGPPGSWPHARGTEMSSTETVPPEMIQEVRQYKLADVIEALGPRQGTQYADWESALDGVDPVQVVRKGDQVYVAMLTHSGPVLKWDETQHPRDPKGGPTGGQFTEGVGHDGSASRPETAPSHARAGAGGGTAVPTPPSPAAAGAPFATDQQGRPAPNVTIQQEADAYNLAHGRPPIVHQYLPSDEGRAGQVADAYDALPLDDSANPEVAAAYQALATEVNAQWDAAVAHGMTFEPDRSSTDAVDKGPYQSSFDVTNDIRDHRHLFFFTGGEPNQFMQARDPVTGYTINDKFRAIHDYYGHAAGGYGFGPRGEYNAWVLHSQMFSPLARRALTTETLGQNSWVNFGKQNYEPDGTYKNIPPAERPYAIQKTALLPESFAHLPGETTLKFDEAQHPRVPGGTAEGGEFAASAPVLQGVDSKANAARELARYQAVDQKRLGDRWDAATYQERLTDAEAELRSLPLIHGTTVEGALGAATNGLHSFVEMQKQSHALLEESDGLREEIDAMVPEKERGVDWSEFTYDDARHLGLSSGASQDMVDKIHELGDLETILQGKTFEADHQLGLDRFVFMTHGKKHPDYGNVAVVIDNKVIQQSWSTEKDIVRMPGSNIGNQIGSGIVQWKQYHPEAVDAYRKSIVKGEDYYKVAAAHPGYLPTRDREELFELKTSSVPKSAIKGFVVYHDLDEAQRLANGLAAKHLKHKVLYVGDVGSRGLVPTGGTYAKAVPYLYHQLKTMQATGRWDEELTNKFREADAETYIL